MFVSADGLKVTLTSKLNTTDSVLPVSAADAAKICAVAGAVNYTYLTVANAGNTETMRATCVAGVVNVVRGQNGTSPITVPSGTCVAFQWVKQAITDFIAQGGGVAGICDITNGSPDKLEIISDPDNSCARKISYKSCPSEARWRFGNVWFKQGPDGCITTEAATDCLVQDGTYENATIEIKDGRICAVSKGTNIVHSGSGCCTCQTCSTNGFSVPLDCEVSDGTIVPGQYGPFTVNACGFITAYNPALNNFNATVQQATVSEFGTVVLVNPAAPAGNSVITYSYLQGILGDMGLDLCSLPTRSVNAAIRLSGCKADESANFSVSELKEFFKTDLDLCSTPAYVPGLLAPTPTTPPVMMPTSELLDATLVVCIGGLTQSVSMRDLFDAIKAYVEA